MGSLHLCNFATANLQQTKFTLLPRKASSISYRGATHVKAGYNLGNQSPDFKLTRDGCHIVKSMEPCISSSCHLFPLKIGIIGLGEFGQFLASAFRRQGNHVLGTSRSDYSEFCQEHGIEFFRDISGMCEAQPDVLLLCNSISSTEGIVREIPFHKLKPDTIIADVLSVKQFPKNLLLDVVPPGFGILCTHPMFGKFSGKNSWEGLRFVYDKVRLAENSIQEGKCERFLDIFQDQGCQMVEMSCEEHDRYAAESQFITHTVARVLSQLDLKSTPVDTKGYETLLELTQKTSNHSTDLYEGLYLYNVNAEKQLEKLDRAFEIVKEKLHGKVREKLRRRIEETIALGRRSKCKQTDDVKEILRSSWIQNQATPDSRAEERKQVHPITL